MDKNKIIQLAEHFKTPHTPWVQSGVDALNCLSPKEQQAVLEFLINYLLLEVRVGLGLAEPEGEVELKIFDKIADIYEEAAGGCYFCSEKVDPNEDEFGPDTKLCSMCRLKLANFTEALGIPAGKVFSGMSVRPQKTRIKIHEK